MQGRKQSGAAIMGIVAAVAVAAAAGAGFFAWKSMKDLEAAQTELNNAKNGLDKARRDLTKATQDSQAQSKAAADAKMSADQLRAELGSVRTVLETEQSAGVRIRQDMALLKEQVSYLSARSAPGVVKGMPKGPGSSAPAPAAPAQKK